MTFTYLTVAVALLGLVLADDRCSGKVDGNYPDMTINCEGFYSCLDGQVIGYQECGPGDLVFDERKGVCNHRVDVPPPCGTKGTFFANNVCSGLADGDYADKANGCKSFFSCLDGNFIGNQNCGIGDIVFDETKGVCNHIEDVPPPCGTKGTLYGVCSGKEDGNHPDYDKGCRRFFSCLDGHFLGYQNCGIGDLVFDSWKGVCNHRYDVPPPCGTREF